MPVIVFVILIVAAFLIIRALRKSKAKENNLVIGEEFDVPLPPRRPAAADNHVISKLYLGTESSGTWVCKNCECENSGSALACCVCNHRR